MSVAVHWDTDPEYVPAERLAEVARAALEYGGRDDLELNVILVGEQELTRLHGEFLDDDSPTDVITFDLGQEGAGPTGEVYISADCARSTAAAREVDAERELALYLVHGVLHLCGLDDHEPEERAAMRAAEQRVMESLGYAPDCAPHDGEV